MAAALSTQQLLAILTRLSLLLTSAAAASGYSTAPPEQPQQLLQWPGLCSNSLADHACRGFSARQPTGRGCHDQLLLILCSARTLRCPSQSSASLENPVCQQSCFRVFRRCRSIEQSFFSYLNINDQLCHSLPNQLCHDWRETSQRDDRSTDGEASSGSSAGVDGEEQNICQAAIGSLPCSQVVYIGDVAKIQRRGATAKLRHPFKKSNFTQGNYTYAALVKLAKAEWLQEAPTTSVSMTTLTTSPPPVMRVGGGGGGGGGYEKVLHLEILRVLYTPNGGGGGHILEPGSVQIVRLKPNCGCAPLKLDQSLIFVGYNSYLENVWKTVTLLPNNGHYKCKIKRCWHKQKQRAAANLYGSGGGGGGGGGGGLDCECPCGKSERRRCQKRSRRMQQTKRRRGAAAAAAAAAAGAAAEGGWRSADQRQSARQAVGKVRLQHQQLARFPAAL